MSIHGPYWTREQAASDINGPDGSPDRARRLAALTAAINTAGVSAGAFDCDVIAWLAGWEPETVQVVIGLIERARAAGDAGLRAEIDTLRAQIDSLEAKVSSGPPLPEGARVSTRHGIGTVIDPAHLYEPAVAIELDAALRNATVRAVVEPVDGLTRLDGTHAAGRGADR